MSEWTKEKLDRLFRAVRQRYPWLPVLAISWLYVTIGRDTVGRQADRARPFHIGLAVSARIPWLALRSLCLVLEAGFLRLLLSPLLCRLKRASFDALAKSWVFPQSDAGSARDFYLGDFADRLGKRNIRLLTLYGKGAGRGWFRLVWSRRHDACRLPELCLLNPFAVFHMAARQCRAAVILFWQSFLEKDGDIRRLLLLVSRDCLRYQTLRNALFHAIGKQALAFWPVRFFVLPYEGIAWEKCLWMGLREARPACTVVGYQHTVIVSEALELRRPSVPPPDIILSIGPKAIGLLKAGHARFPCRLIPFGSFQHAAVEGGKTPPRTEPKTLLVLPEGLPSEMVFLFDAAMDLALLLPDYRIVLRCHPAVPFRKVRSRLRRLPEQVPNVILSDSPNIGDDFNRASLVLYRGTAAVLYAVLRGLKPFYLARAAAEENVDPLFELEAWRERTGSVEALKQGIAAYACEPLDRLEKEWQMALEYVQEYVKPVEASSLECFLASLSTKGQNHDHAAVGRP